MASGQGCARTFSCPYHGWTYNLDGSVRGIPARQLSRFEQRNIRIEELFAVERGGLVYVQQEGTPKLDALDTAPISLNHPNHCFIRATPLTRRWKLLTETLLEDITSSRYMASTLRFRQCECGGIVRSKLARHLPLQAHWKLRSLPRDEREIEGFATLVYHLFQNVSVSNYQAYECHCD